VVKERRKRAKIMAKTKTMAAKARAKKTVKRQPKAEVVNEVARFYIENNANTPPEQLAGKTGLTQATVQTVLDSLPQPERLTAGRQMGRDKGIVVMTESASMLADDARVILRGEKMSREQFAKNNKNRIHTIDPRKATK
jgi:hypothetical protein